MFSKMRNWCWSIFGNDDDPEPPEWHKPNSKYWIRYISWYIRNPFHNLFNYRWGVVKEIREGKYKMGGKTPPHVFNPDKGWNYILPFFSYQSEVFTKFPFLKGRYLLIYAGWRPMGALGFKFNLKRN